MLARKIIYGLFLVAICFFCSKAQGADFYYGAVIGSSEPYDSVCVYDTPPETTTIDFYGRYDYLVMNDSSTINIYEGGVFWQQMDSKSKLFNSSTANSYKGGAFLGGSGAFIDIYDSSTLNVYGGSIHSFLFAYNSSTVNLYDGSLFHIDVFDYSTLNIYSGYVGTFMNNYYVPSTATVNIYGYDFKYDPEAFWAYIPETGEGWWISLLLGYGFDGNTIIYSGLPDPKTHDNINLIPEPATLLLLGLGSLALLGKHRRGKIYSK